MFKRALKMVESFLGNQESDGEMLQEAGVYLFEDRFNGVRAKDQLNDLEDGFYIANLDNSNQGGSHWVALAVEPDAIFYFDSFARPNAKTLQLSDPNRIIVQEADPDVLQPNKSDDCGQRCLAWLILYSNSPRSALSI